MKKFLTLVLALSFVLTAAACGSGSSSSSEAAPDVSGSEGSSYAVNPAEAKVAIICETVGTELFLTQVVDAANAAKEKYGFELSIMESSDADAFLTNARAAVEEGYTLILGIGWRSADAIAMIATDYPDRAEYAIIDSTVENDNVTCITFKEWEAAYVMGVFTASCFPEENLFGYLDAFQTQKTYNYRWGFTQGVKSVNPEAEFIFIYTGSYTDPVKGKELSLQMLSQGCKFIYGGAASSNEGIFALALERPGEVYSIGQDADVTKEENPYVISSQLKNTGECTTYVLDRYFAGTLEDGVSILGLAEKAVGVVNVTADAIYRNTDIVTDEAIAAAQKAVDDILSGAIVLEVPLEETSEEQPAA